MVKNSTSGKSGETKVFLSKDLPRIPSFGSLPRRYSQWPHRKIHRMMPTASSGSNQEDRRRCTWITFIRSLIASVGNDCCRKNENGMGGNGNKFMRMGRMGIIIPHTSSWAVLTRFTTVVDKRPSAECMRLDNEFCAASEATWRMHRKRPVHNVYTIDYWL